MYTIIAGTNRPGSKTLRIAKEYERILLTKDIRPNLVSLVDLDVSTRNDGIRRLEQEVLIPTTKFIFVSPEYNGSIPGVLKSLIDNTDIEKVWWGKKALLVGVSTGRAGNLRGMEHLTGILHYVKVVVHPNKLPISVVHKLLNEDGTLADQLTLSVIGEQIDEFILF
jgi:chromate reductase, NAD(P)H dehydrogenase (quinone)